MRLKGERSGGQDLEPEGNGLGTLLSCERDHQETPADGRTVDRWCRSVS